LVFVDTKPQDHSDAVVGFNVHRLRKAKGLTQAELAEKVADFGLSSFRQQTVMKIESGNRSVRLVEGIAIALTLDVTPVDLFDLDATAVQGRDLVRRAFRAWETLARAKGDALLVESGLRDWLHEVNSGAVQASDEVVAEVRKAIDRLSSSIREVSI
jgi:transcriptional regulator with XRE-family HTH domain